MAKDAPVKKKFVVTKVTVRREASVSDYLKTGSAKADLKHLLKGVGDLNNWVMETKDDRVTAAWPEVDKHPGHVHGKDWKLNIEASKHTVDRLILSKRSYDSSTVNKKDPNTLNVEIYCAAFVETDTH